MSIIKHKIIAKKSSDIVNVTVDGAYGGLLSNGKLNLNFYTETLPIPNETTISYNTESNLSETEHSDNIVGVFERQIVSSISFDLNKAKEVYLWLGEMIKQADIERKEGKDASSNI